MRQDALNQRLSGITTWWVLVRCSQEGTGREARAAQQALLERYGPPVRRYLCRVIGDPHTADELSQEFGLLLISGKFRRADPGRGRFRDYIKGVLRNLAAGHHRRRPAGGPDGAEPVAPDTTEELDRQFDEEYRNDLLARTWTALAGADATHFAVLQFRANHPRLPSRASAMELGRRLGREVTADWVRQTLSRARARFADLLIDEIARSLRSVTPQEVEDELRELKLLPYCRPALDRRYGGSSQTRAVRSQPADASLWPSGANETAQTSSV